MTTAAGADTESVIRVSDDLVEQIEEVASMTDGDLLALLENSPEFVDEVREDLADQDPGVVFGVADELLELGYPLERVVDLVPEYARGAVALRGSGRC